MTRINCVPVTELNNKHLMAEYYEMSRIVKLSGNAFTRCGGDISKLKIPSEYTLGRGHVTFFYDKLTYIIDRYYWIFRELKDRGFNVDAYKFELIIQKINKLPSILHNTWSPTKQAVNINRQRIAERLAVDKGLI